MAADEFILIDIQLAVQKRLRSVAWFNDIEVISEDTDPTVNELITSRVEAAIGKIGTVAIVMPVVARMADSAETPAIYMHFQQSVRIVENPIINRADSGTGKLAIQTVCHALLALHHYNPSADYPDLAMFTVDPAAPFRRVPDLQRIIYDINLLTKGGIIAAAD